MTIAATIQSQIGNRAFAMLGAFNFLDHGDALGFRVKGSRKANHIKVTLNADDTYTLTFSKIRGYNIKAVSTVAGVYVGNMHDAIERATGLYTSL